MLSQEGTKIVITGITGNQGGSVLKALERSSAPYVVTGITRDASKESAQALAASGLNMVSLVLSTDNLENAAKVYQGADVVFAMTNFWEHQDKKREIAEGKMMVDAAKRAGIKTFIWAGLPNYSQISNGKYVHVDHFDGKAEVEAYAKSIGVPIVSVQPASYMSNFGPSGMMAPRLGPDGNYGFFFPQGFRDGPVSLIDVEKDFGLFVQAVIETEDFPAGSTVLAQSQEITGAEFLQIMSKAAGREIKVMEAPLPAFIEALSGAVGETMATEVGEMFAVQSEYGFYGGADPSKSLAALAGKATTWEEYVTKQDWSKL